MALDEGAHTVTSDSKAAVESKSGADTYSSAMATAYRYMDWMLSPFRPYLHGDIVEVGIGHASYFEALKSCGNYLGIDIDERSVADATRRFPDTRFARADILQPGFLDAILPQKADAILSVSVLEHIEDDARAIGNLVEALKPGGCLLASVPAHMALFNDMDRLAGHHRRYDRARLERILAPLSVKVEKLSYFNPIGGLGWWANKFRRYESLDSAGINGQIVLFERYVLPVSRALDPLTRGFFGQSLICVARRL